MSYENYLIREAQEGADQWCSTCEHTAEDCVCNNEQTVPSVKPRKCKDGWCYCPKPRRSHVGHVYECDVKAGRYADRAWDYSTNRVVANELTSPELRARIAATTCRGCGVDLSCHGHAPECENLPEPSQG